MAQITVGHLLVDMDGTVVDSAGPITAAWASWAQHYDVAAPDLQQALGGTSLDTVHQLVPESLEKEALEWITREQLSTAAETKPTPGARDFLLSLPSESWTLVTSSRATITHARMEAAGLPLPVRMITSDDYIRGKPDPEPYLVALRRMPKTVLPAIAVEDSGPGVASALSAALKVIGVLTYLDRHELPGATWRVKSLEYIAVEVRSVEHLRLEFTEA